MPAARSTSLSFFAASNWRSARRSAAANRGGHGGDGSTASTMVAEVQILLALIVLTIWFDAAAAQTQGTGVSGNLVSALLDVPAGSTETVLTIPGGANSTLTTVLFLSNFDRIFPIR